MAELYDLSTNLSGMTLELLGALIVAGLAGPVLRLPMRWGVPVAVGELLIGVVFGDSGFQKIPFHHLISFARRARQERNC